MTDATNRGADQRVAAPQLRSAGELSCPRRLRLVRRAARARGCRSRHGALPGDRADRPVGLWEVDLPPDPESDARNGPGRPAGRDGRVGRGEHLRPEQRANEVRRHIGMVFQRPNPFPAMSIYDNVLAGLRFTRIKVAPRTTWWRNRLRGPDCGTRSGTGSGTWVATSRAVSNSVCASPGRWPSSPKVLLMDEPCSALDPASTSRIEQTIEEIASDVTVVIVTHNMQQAQRVSHTCAFFLAAENQPGRIVENGPTEQCSAAHGPTNGGLRRWAVWLHRPSALPRIKASASRVLSGLSRAGPFPRRRLRRLVGALLRLLRGAPPSVGLVRAMPLWPSSSGMPRCRAIPGHGQLPDQLIILGLNDFAKYPQVDFGASEIGYSTNQADSSPLPASIPVSPRHRRGDVSRLQPAEHCRLADHQPQLNSQVLAGIFSGTITRMERSGNQGVESRCLVPVASSSWSSERRVGRQLHLLQLLGDRAVSSRGTRSRRPSAPPPGPSDVAQPPAGQRTVGPYSFGNWTSENGSDTASEYVYRNLNSITYVETGYALLHHNPCAEVLNAAVPRAPSE